MIPLIHPSIFGKISLVSNSILSDCTRGDYSRRYYYLGSIHLCGEQSSTVSHFVFMRKLFPISIAIFIIFLYSSWYIIVIHSNRRQRRDISPTIDIHVYAVFKFLWTHCYVAYIYVSPTKIRFNGHLCCMDDLMCKTNGRHNPYNHECRVSFGSLIFIGLPDGTMNDQSWFTHIFVYHSYFFQWFLGFT